MHYLITGHYSYCRNEAQPQYKEGNMLALFTCEMNVINLIGTALVQSIHHLILVKDKC